VKQPIEPFANESDSLGVGGLTVENRTDRVSLYGSLDLTRDKRGLADARELKAVVDAVVAALEKDGKLPDKVAAPAATKEADNPFR
jgi:hypothetical protein